VPNATPGFGPESTRTRRPHGEAAGPDSDSGRVGPARYWEAARARAATRKAVLLWGSLLLALLVYGLFKTETG